MKLVVVERDQDQLVRIDLFKNRWKKQVFFSPFLSFLLSFFLSFIHVIYDVFLFNLELVMKPVESTKRRDRSPERSNMVIFKKQNKKQTKQ